MVPFDRLDPVAQGRTGEIERILGGDHDGNGKIQDRGTEQIPAVQPSRRDGSKCPEAVIPDGDRFKGDVT